MKPKSLVWVHPKFKRMLQKEKGETGLDMIDLTEQMANRKKKKRGGGFFEF